MPYFHPAIEDEQWLQKHTIKLPKPKQPLQCSHSILLALPSSVRCGISISESDPILNFISWNLHGSASWALVKEYLKLSDMKSLPAFYNRVNRSYKGSVVLWTGQFLLWEIYKQFQYWEQNCLRKRSSCCMFCCQIFQIPTFPTKPETLPHRTEQRVTQGSVALSCKKMVE